MIAVVSRRSFVQLHRSFVFSDCPLFDAYYVLWVYHKNYVQRSVFVHTARAFVATRFVRRVFHRFEKSYCSDDDWCDQWFLLASWQQATSFSG